MNVIVSRESDINPEDAALLVGKTVAEVEAYEHAIVLTFTDGSHLKVNGHRWHTGSLGCRYTGVYAEVVA
jgi:hypothetical protein